MRIPLLVVVTAGLLTSIAGCASSGSDGAVSMATLRVHAGVFGGPERPNGKMAVSNAPQQDESIAATDSAGRTWHARTDTDGVAVLRLPAGRYTVTPAQCGTPVRVRVTDDSMTRVNLHCDVP